MGKMMFSFMCINLVWTVSNLWHTIQIARAINNLDSVQKDIDKLLSIIKQNKGGICN